MAAPRHKPDTEPSDDHGRLQRFEYALGGAFLLLSIAVIAANIEMGIWKDELSNLNAASPTRSFAEDYRLWGFYDGHPPFYSFLLYVWFAVFPFTEISARAFPLLVCALILSGGYWVAVPADRPTVFRVIVLMCSSFFLLYYLLEIRSYALQISLSAACAMCLHVITSEPPNIPRARRAKMVLPVLLLLIGSTHLWGILLAGSIFVSCLFFVPPKENVRFYLYGLAALALATPPHLLIAYYVHIGVGPAGILQSFVESPLVGFKLLSTLLYDLQEQMFRTVRSKALFAASLIGLVAFMKWSVFRHDLRRVLPLIVTLAILVIVVPLLSVVVGSIYRSYALVVMVPFIFMTLAVLVSSESLRRDVSVCLFIGFVAANFGSVPFFEKFPDKPYRFHVVDGEVTKIERFGDGAKN